MSVKRGSKFSVGRIATFCKNGRYAERIGAGTPIYLAAVLEYVMQEVILLAEQEAKADGKKRIKPRHIMMAIKKDAELNEYFKGGQFCESGVMPTEPLKKAGKKKGKATDTDSESE